MRDKANVCPGSWRERSGAVEERKVKERDGASKFARRSRARRRGKSEGRDGVNAKALSKVRADGGWWWYRWCGGGSGGGGPRDDASAVMDSAAMTYGERGRDKLR